MRLNDYAALQGILYSDLNAYDQNPAQMYHQGDTAGLAMKRDSKFHMTQPMQREKTNNSTASEFNHRNMVTSTSFAPQKQIKSSLSKLERTDSYLQGTGHVSTTDGHLNST